METIIKNNNYSNQSVTKKKPTNKTAADDKKDLLSKGKVRGSHQVRRAATRLKVLEAGISILGEMGYHAATTMLIAKRAGVSRGALLHQFPTHSDLMFAIVQHVVLKHHEHNARMLMTLQPGVDQFKGLTDALWQKSQSPAMMALIEIHLASRSVPELAKGLGWRMNALIKSETEYTLHLAQEAGIEDRRAVEALSTLTIASIWGLSILRLKLWEESEINDAFQLLKTNLDFFIKQHSTI